MARSEKEPSTDTLNSDLKSLKIGKWKATTFTSGLAFDKRTEK